MRRVQLAAACAFVVVAERRTTMMVHGHDNERARGGKLNSSHHDSSLSFAPTFLSIEPCHTGGTPARRLAR